ncbi:MAG: group III truncated hemoglobin [Reyranella sp.]|nr:group III truncated hemoglobin [Reyranella sp.]
MSGLAFDEIEGVDEEGLARLVDRFYAAVRADALIGPVFNDAIDDWPHHLDKLAAFWSSLMLTSGRYKGMPMAAHLKHRARITPPMFDRWLVLWREAT